MRLHSITVRHYRLHKECRVEFDDALTLVGGPNESGKSTLIEAAHRAFFLNAKGNTEAHRAMQSVIHDGRPEVEIEFTAHGRRHTLIKQFKGANGVTRLTCHGGQTWTHEEAEEKLAELTGAPHVKANRIHEPWAHLWIMQGRSGDNPVAQAGSEYDNLMRHLQTGGGAAVMQSGVDARLAACFAEWMEQAFTQGGTPRSQSDAGRAEQELREAETVELQARQVLETLDTALADHAGAAARLAEAEAALRTLHEEQARLDERAARIAALRRDEASAAASAQDAVRQHQARLGVEKNIAALRAQIALHREALQPGRERFAAHGEALRLAKSHAGEAESAHLQAEDALSAARARHELALARQGVAEKKQACADLADRETRVARHRERLAALRSTLAALPQFLDEHAVNELQSAQQSVAKAAATLAGMAAGVEVIESAETVTVDGEPLSAGSERILPQDAEIRVGQGTRLRVRPGGGISLAQARRAEADARAALSAKLAEIGVASVEEAARCARSRARTQADIKAEEAGLRGLGADHLPRELEHARQALASAEAEAARRLKALDGMTDCRTPVSELRALLAQAEGVEKSARAARDAALRQHQQLEKQTADLAAGMRQAEAAADDLESRLRYLIEQHGEDAARAATLAESAGKAQAEEAVLEGLRTRLADLSPADLEADRARIQRSIQQQNQKRDSALQLHAGAASTLRADGGSDPVAALKTARSRLHAARARQETLALRSAALRRLHELYVQERQALSDQLTRPLAERVTGYLQRVFGPEAGILIAMDGATFSGLALGRGSAAAIGFDQLSGGAREQVAAAFRLAMAEILAQAHDGCLPVVFDDAFAYSDPERVRRLQAMLDLAARRGLQIILLTCAPGDYALLGAREVTLA